jgi:predicted ATPase/DNA-binding winged helix-turn-helix (wHTH) protein
MLEQSRHLVYEFDGWELDLARRELRARGVPVPLGSRAFEIFVVLVQSAGELVTKDELMARVWPSAIIEENTLEVHMSAIRKALGTNRGAVKTSFGRGYRLVGDWTIRKASTAADPVALDPSRIAVQPFLTNVPAAGSELIGRTAAVQQLQEFLYTYRAITLTGPGGIGKTALALEVARSLAPAFHGDRCLVDLVCQLDPTLVPSTVASVLGLKLGGEEISPESVARAIGGKKLLLVLDNCEHVIDAAARLAEAVLHLCPAASIIATSREVLRIEGEQVYRVPPLDVPSQHQEESDVLLRHSAVQLFMARVRTLDSEFSPHGESLRAIAAICRRLDGIPLAIEFAAARAAMLGPDLVLSRLDKRFELLAGGRRTALPRHQTLRATLDWSYDLLPEPEQCLLRRLGVFAAGFTLEAAHAVMSDRGHTAFSLLEQIANLVAKSLVTLEGSAPTGRWRLLDTIRDYGLEKLAEFGETAQVARRCVEFFRDLVRPAMYGSQVQTTVDDMARYAREIDNVRACLDWSFSSVGDSAIGIALTAAYAPVWIHLSLIVECRERAERALANLSRDANLSAPLSMQLHSALGLALYFTMGSAEKTEMALRKALEIAEALDDVDAQLRTLWVLMALQFYCSKCHDAHSTAERFSRAAHRTADPALARIAYRLTGNTLHYAGQNREAQHLFERVMDRYVAPKDLRYTMWFPFDQRLLARAMLARVLCVRGFVDQAVYQAQLSLEEAEAMDNKLSVCGILHHAVCPIALLTGDLVAAQRAVTTFIDLTTSVNVALWSVLARCLEGKLLIRRGEFALGSTVLMKALETCERTGWTVWYPEFLGALAEGLAGLGQLAEALTTIERALASADRGGERWFVAELLRTKGELLLQQAGDQSLSGAEQCYSAALAVAREQDALWLELRAALSFARLRVRQDRQDDARQLLAPVYNRFTEGFETPDLRSASAILQSLPSGPA